MCVIIIKQRGQNVPADVTKNSARINPHGLGVIWLDTFEVTIHKSTEHKVLNTDRPYIAHFRYATVGAIGADNTHPFRCGANKNEWLMMNGTIRGLGNSKDCDSKVLAHALGDKPRHTWKKELQQYDSRFVSVNVQNKTYQVYNKHLWTQREGVWYSKDNVLMDNLVAVYGTLKKGNSNYYNYLMSAEFVGSGKTKDKYPMIIAGLPYLIEERGKGFNVEVDVFKVSDSKLRDLDALEGHPKWYRRKQVEVKVNGTSMMCWIYFNPTQRVDGREMHSTFIQSWARYDKPRYEQVYKPAEVYNTIKKTYPKEPLFLDEWLEEDEILEFDITNEKPICIDCFHDVEYDGFANYHCSGCNSWFAEDEVIKFQP